MIKRSFLYDGSSSQGNCGVKISVALKFSKVELFSLLEAFITNLVGTLMRYANLL